MKPTDMQSVISEAGMRNAVGEEEEDEAQQSPSSDPESWLYA